MTSSWRSSGVRRTSIAFLASLLGVVPLAALFTDSGWLIDVWLAMAIVIVPALLLRLRHPPGALQIWAGLLLLVPWLTVRYVPDHAVLGLLPGRGAWHDVGALFTDLHRMTSTQTVPVHSTPATDLALSVMLGLLVALVDLLAVVGRHGAVAAVPLLIVYTVSGAITRHAVPWPLFLLAAAAFLMLLAVDAHDDIDNWGHRVRRVQAPHAGARVAVSGQRIAVWSILLALGLSLIVPTRSVNLLSQAFRSGSGGGTGGIDPFAALKGDLVRKSPVELARVTVPTGLAAKPFYLRASILSIFRGDGWVAGAGDPTEPIGQLPSSPVLGSGNLSFQATISVTGLTGTPPVFAVPTSIRGLDPATLWSPADQVLTGSTLNGGERYFMSVDQVEPTVAQLQDAPDAGAGLGGQWLQLPAVPQQVSALVDRLTANALTPYDKARAISDFFTDPASGFTYSLQTQAGDSGSDLVNFLTHRQGYCQQYAAAMGVMLRLAGVPARVVLGYTHAAPDAHGNFVVTTDDAHAWVEAYFGGIGWVPFDPTPAAGITGGAANDLAWAPHPSASAVTLPSIVKPSGSISSTGAGTVAHSASAQAGSTHSGSDGARQAWWILVPALALLALATVLALPWTIRTRRRRRRLHAARRDGPDPLWAELSDTATDLGYRWSSNRTPRQVADWLAEPAEPARASLHALAVAVERSRYARPEEVAGSAGTTLSDDLAAIDAALRAGMDRKARIRTRIWPASVRWSRHRTRAH